MKRIWLPPALMALVAIVYATCAVCTADAATKPAKKPAQANVSCGSCHADFSKVLPKEHPAVPAKDLASCTACHPPAPTGLPRKNGYSARMHLAHLPPKGNLDCTGCHTWTPDKSFGLIAVKGSWGAPSKDDMELMKKTFQSWTSSQYSDHHHARAGVVCTSCHGKNLPKTDDSVENSRCLECHGPMDKLVKKSERKDFADRNPHKSHLGDVNCTVCHHEHSASKVYCLSCHQKFDMKIPGEEKK